MAGFVERDHAKAAAFSSQLYEASIMGDIVPGQLLKFASAQTGMKKKADHVPFLGLAHGEDLLVFPVVEHPHLRRVLVQRLDLQAGIGQIVIFGKPAAEAFQGHKMCVARTIFVFLQNGVDVNFDMLGLEVGGMNRGKFGKPVDNHFIMDLGARFVTSIVN